MQFVSWNSFSVLNVFHTFLVAHKEHSSTEQQTQHIGSEIVKVPLDKCDIFLRDPYEAFTRSVRDLGFAREGRSARRSTMLYNSLFFPPNLSPPLYPTPSYSSLLSSHDQTDAIIINRRITQECCVYVMHRSQCAPQSAPNKFHHNQQAHHSRMLRICHAPKPVCPAKCAKQVLS